MRARPTTPFLFALPLFVLACSAAVAPTDAATDATGMCTGSPPPCSPGCSDVAPTPTCSNVSGAWQWVCPPPPSNCPCGGGTTPPGCYCNRGFGLPQVVCPDAGGGDASSDAGCPPTPIHCIPDCSGHEPPAMCVAGSWVCPAATPCDAGAGTFSCGGGSVQCNRYTQYCDLSDVAECLPIPASCPSPPTCACLAGMGHTACMDDGTGGITTHSPGG